MHEGHQTACTAGGRQTMRISSSAFSHRSFVCVSASLSMFSKKSRGEVNTGIYLDSFMRDHLFLSQDRQGWSNNLECVHRWRDQSVWQKNYPKRFWQHFMVTPGLDFMEITKSALCMAVATVTDFHKLSFYYEKGRLFPSYSVFSPMAFFDLGVDICGIKRYGFLWRIWEMDWNIKYQNICEWKYWKLEKAFHFHSKIAVFQNLLVWQQPHRGLIW